MTGLWNIPYVHLSGTKYRLCLLHIQNDKFSFEGRSAYGIREEQRNNKNPLGFHTDPKTTTFIYQM